MFRFVPILALAAASAAPSLAQDGPPRRLTEAQLESFLMQAREKPGAGMAARDSCRWANDLECDEPDIGTGACEMATDYSDCRFLREGETDTCRWANDGECDEPGLGTGVCTQGTDRTDCAGIAHLRFATDSCTTAFNGVCEERGRRPACEPRTDRADCLGRERPMTINDHFQGRDDREIMDTGVYPWTAVGEIDFADSTACTATLVRPAVIVTAAHCVHDENGRLAPRGTFRAGFARRGGPAEARISAVFVSPRYETETFNNTSKIDGADWAFLRLDAPIGEEVGMIEIAPLESLDGVVLTQAGYSWDTGDNLSGHVGCEAVALNGDHTLEHRCDTTRGDSGSPFVVSRGDGFVLVAVDSNFRSSEAGPPVNIAAAAQAFAPYLEDFEAGRIGEPVSTGPRVVK